MIPIPPPPPALAEWAVAITALCIPLACVLLLLFVVVLAIGTILPSKSSGPHNARQMPQRGNDDSRMRQDWTERPYAERWADRD